MCHIYGGGAGIFVDSHNGFPGLVSQLRVQIGQRLIHQEYLWFLDQRPPQGHTLLLSAGQVPGLPVLVFIQVQIFCSILNPLVNLVQGNLFHFQPESHVLINRHVGIQRIGLKYHGNVPVFGKHIVHMDPVNVNVPIRYGLKTCNHTQQRCLSASGRPQQHAEIIVSDLQVHLIDRLIFPIITFHQIFYLYFSHF